MSFVMKPGWTLRLAKQGVFADEVTRFSKKVSGGLEQVRNGAGDGLFSAYPGEHNWGVAHRILMPAYGPSHLKVRMVDH